MGLDIKSFAIGAATGGSGREPVIQSKTITENGTYTAPSDVDGYSPITVDVEPNLLENAEAHTNGTYNPREMGYDGFGVCIVDVSPDLEDTTITANGTYTSEEHDGFGEVVVNVSAVEPVIESKTITENGTYTPTSGVDGFAPVVVNVPTPEPDLEDITITENGTYTSEEHDGYGEVVVNVPSEEPIEPDVPSNDWVRPSNYPNLDLLTVNNEVYFTTNVDNIKITPVINIYKAGSYYTAYTSYEGQQIILEQGHIENNTFVADKQFTASACRSGITSSEFSGIQLWRVKTIDWSPETAENKRYCLVPGIDNIADEIYFNVPGKVASSYSSIELKLDSANNILKNLKMENGIVPTILGTALSKIELNNCKLKDNRYFGCYSIKKLDLSTCDTSELTSMEDMIRCVLLKEIDLSGLDTSNITNMTSLFLGCPSLEKIDMSGCDTSNVINMSGMFSGCSSLKVFKAPSKMIADNWTNTKMPVLYRTGYISFMGALEETTTTKTLTPTNRVKTLLTEEDIAIATAKGYTVAL